MRSQMIIAILLLITGTIGQNVRVLDVTEEDSYFFNLSLAEDERLVINFLVNPQSLTFISSSLRQIPDGAFSEPSLIRFVAMACQISEISPEDFDGATGLTSLDLSGNHLQTIQNNTFSEAPRLEIINLSNNKITHLNDFAFAGLPYLTNLSLYINQIKDVSSVVFNQVPSLQWLDFGYNQLTNISFGMLHSLVNLDTLWLEYNQFEEFDSLVFVALKNLKIIYLHGNQLANINVVDIGYVLPGLESISLGRNNWECSRLARILTNLRKHNVNVYNVNDQSVSDPVLLEGIACYEEST